VQSGSEPDTIRGIDLLQQHYIVMMSHVGCYVGWWLSSSSIITTVTNKQKMPHLSSAIGNLVL
jgi:hypothetical protein